MKTAEKNDEKTVRVTHQLGSMQRTGKGNPHFLLTNKKGNYISFGSPNVSDFQGIFIFDSSNNGLFKTVQNITLAKSPTSIKNYCNWVERGTGKTRERFYLSSNALIYEIENYTGAVTITLDSKKLYDDNPQGRIYEHYKGPAIGVGKAHKVLYKKYADDTQDYIQYERHILIAAVSLNGKKPTIKKIDTWRPTNYPYDQRRGMTGERHIYDAVSIQIDSPSRIIITSSHNPEKAEEKLSYVLEHQDAVINAIQKYPGQRLAWAGKDLELALATNALDALVTKLKDDRRGIFAGLPWFFQYWMRDEAICLKAILLQGQYGLLKEVIMRWLPDIAGGGRGALSGKEGAIGLRTADGPGLIALRTTELLRTLQKRGELNHYFSKEELIQLGEAFRKYLEQLTYQHGLVTNAHEETWMDTGPDGDGRAGARIEIQACTLAIHDLLMLLADLFHDGPELKEQKKVREDLLTATKEWFFDKRGFLLDGFHDDGTSDHCVRPNIFLAWYIYPDLLSREEWTRAFLNALPALWQEWGAITSIAHDDSSYQKTHTGCDNKSYHHGDSWMFINNIVAMALFLTDPHRFHDYIDALTRSATDDLLFKGFIGHASEISDAEAQNPAGCWAQAWSAATLIELLHMMRRE
ncbi:hypothetical protein GOV10_05380 [Candidatus Woesearchaeota archaeon]|nr:hypothetical protein [Candidatus Woesearchaeota archaeon]